ncbi:MULTISPECIES: DUF6465 family protein [unclassified Butyrivibrio]|uniref:DUF6465 family protein n=1 Tax=unclassified Butyrivibrio TaxID=2639466 RepID=UPI0003B62DE7|nr:MULTISPECIES: DUF6465 family protein [unclassified Butyrivibrio]SDB24546.1 hypothetical protein SAMN02910263_01184 [Butyrivibrio sp. INlla16]SEL20070.1 hypothetical protein SAMN04487770_10743 [Butyrivibrio sp. ob235]
MARQSSVKRALEATGSFATAQKNIVVQYQNSDRTTDDILKKIKEDALSHGVSEADFQKIDVYIKPEEHKVFYVVNGNVNGCVDF